MILDKIVEAKKQRLTQHKARVSEIEIRHLAENFTGDTENSFCSFLS